VGIHQQWANFACPLSSIDENAVSDTIQDSKDEDERYELVGEVFEGVSGEYGRSGEEVLFVVVGGTAQCVRREYRDR